MLERSQRIVVAVRKLVHEKHELQPDSESIIVKDNHTVLAIEQQSTAIIPLRKTEKKPLSTITFDFDHAYDSNCTSEKVYQSLVGPLVELAGKGGKALCIIHGPATGKAPNPNSKVELAAMYKMAIQNLFKSEKQPVSLLAFEVKGDKQSYLLSEGSKPIQVGTEQEALGLIELAAELRALSLQERKNAHFFLQICVKGVLNQGVLTFADLFADPQDKNKGNASEVGRAMILLQQRDMQKGRVYVSNKSKLAQNIKDALEGCSKTVLLVNVNPCIRFTDFNVDTLRFAQKLKGVRANVNNFRQARVNKQMILPKAAIKLNDSAGSESIAKQKKEPRVTFNVAPKALQPCHKGLLIKNFRENNGLTNRPAKKSDRKMHNKTFSQLPMKDKVNQSQPTEVQKPIINQIIKIKTVVQSDNTPSNSAINYKTQDQEQNLLGDIKQSLTERAAMFGIAELSESIYKTVVWADHPPDLIVPLTHSSQFKWDNVVKQFDEWDPQKAKGQTYFDEAHQFLIEQLVQQQDAVGVLHSETISKEVQTLKSEIDLVNKLQKNRAECDPLDYIDTVEMSVELKISILLKLKEKITGFRRHLGQQQRCQDKIGGEKDESEDLSRQFVKLEESLLQN